MTDWHHWRWQVFSAPDKKSFLTNDKSIVYITEDSGLGLLWLKTNFFLKWQRFKCDDSSLRTKQSVNAPAYIDFNDYLRAETLSPYVMRFLS